MSWKPGEKSPNGDLEKGGWKGIGKNRSTRMEKYNPIQRKMQGSSDGGENL